MTTSRQDWEQIRGKIHDILKKAPMYRAAQDRPMERTFLTAYQIAALLMKQHRALIESLPSVPQNVGGKSGGENSLAKYIARKLSSESKPLESEIEIHFLSTKGLEGFSFLDESDETREPSGNEFSMFRIVS